MEPFEAWAKKKLLDSPFIHADETGINLDGKGIWLHNLSNDKVTLYHADERRGKEGMDRMEVLAHYRGHLVHDHLKSYYRYEDCVHCLCNSHHLRELERAFTEDHQTWAKSLQYLLIEINKAVEVAGGVLSVEKQIVYQERYRNVLKLGDDECPRPPPKEPGKRGRQKK